MVDLLSVSSLILAVNKYLLFSNLSEVAVKHIPSQLIEEPVLQSLKLRSVSKVISLKLLVQELNVKMEPK